MESAYWYKKWESDRPGFHLSEANPCLVKHFHQLEVSRWSACAAAVVR